jgi:hypothetical protein
MPSLTGAVAFYVLSMAVLGSSVEPEIEVRTSQNPSRACPYAALLGAPECSPFCAVDLAEHGGRTRSGRYLIAPPLESGRRKV